MSGKDIFSNFMNNKPRIKLRIASEILAIINLKDFKDLSITPKICIITDTPPKDAQAHIRAKTMFDDPYSERSFIDFDISRK